jgi:serine/threonine-protein kinase
LRAIARAPDVLPPEGAGLVGQRVGRFRVLRKLGAGGMGVVYEAEDERLGRRVALKVLAHGDDNEARARLVREARSASQVLDSHVAVIYEAGEDDGIAYIAMELVDGETLAAWLHTARPLPERVRVACEIASAVARAHAQGIVHRDLKPGNVMIGRDGSAKVLDFGLAKRPAGALLGEQGETATREGRLVGTPSYMSPEQVKGKPVDARSDVVSVGTLAYELFTGRRPFRGDTITELLIAIDRDDPQPMRDASPHLPPSLVAVVERCLRKRPEERFASGSELLAALERARGLAGRRSSSSSLPWPQRGRSSRCATARPRRPVRRARPRPPARPKSRRPFPRR